MTDTLHFIAPRAIATTDTTPLPKGREGRGVRAMGPILMLNRTPMDTNRTPRFPVRPCTHCGKPSWHHYSGVLMGCPVGRTYFEPAAQVPLS